MRLGDIQTTHVQNADTASTAIGAASATQQVYVLGVYYRNGSAGTLTPTLVANSKTMWGGEPQAAGASKFYSFTGVGEGGGLPVSDGVNHAVTFLATASATSDLTVWWFYGPGA